jgi:hypothetical protein
VAERGKGSITRSSQNNISEGCEQVIGKNTEGAVSFMEEEEKAVLGIRASGETSEEASGYSTVAPTDPGVCVRVSCFLAA